MPSQVGKGKQRVLAFLIAVLLAVSPLFATSAWTTGKALAADASAVESAVKDAKAVEPKADSASAEQPKTQGEQPKVQGEKPKADKEVAATENAPKAEAQPKEEPKARTLSAEAKEYVNTFTTDIGKVTLTYKTADEALAAKIQGAKLKADLISQSDPDYLNCLNAMYSRFDGEPKYYAWRFMLMDGDNQIDIPEGATFDISYLRAIKDYDFGKVKGLGEKPKYFSVSGDKLVDLTVLSTEEVKDKFKPTMYLDKLSKTDSPVFIAYDSTTGRIADRFLKSYTKVVDADFGHVKVTFKTADAELAKRVMDGTVVREKLEETDPAVNVAKTELAAKYSGDLVFSVWKYKASDNGGTFEFPEGAQIELVQNRSIAELGEAPKYFTVGADRITEIDLVKSEGTDGAFKDTVAFPANSPLVGFKTEGAKLKKFHDFKPGTYSITANLYVVAADSPIGKNAYMTNPNFPPMFPTEDNGKLVVGEDGSLEVTVYPVSELFTLQAIEGGKDFHVVSTKRGGKAQNYGPYSDRITEVVGKLDNISGIYKMGTCTQYPVPFGSTQHWRMEVALDFNSMKPYSGDHGQTDVFSKTFNDEATNTQLTVSTENKEMAKELESAQLKVVKYPEGGADKARITKVLKTLFETDPIYDGYNVKLVGANGKIIELVDTKAMFTIPVPNEHVKAYQIVGSSLEEPTIIFKDNKLLIQTNRLGGFACAQMLSSEIWEDIKLKTDMEGVTGRWKIALNPVFGSYKGRVFAKVKTVKTDEGTAVIPAIFFTAESSGVPAGQEPALTMSSNQSTLSYSFPVTDKVKKIYLIERAADKKTYIPVNYTIKNGRADITLYEAFTEEPFIGFPDQLARGLASTYSEGITGGSEWDKRYYLLFSEEDSKTVQDPYIPAKIMYRAADVQLAVLDKNTDVVGPIGDGLTVKNGMVYARNAGTYHVSFQPKAGYTWADGSSEPKAYDIVVNKALLTPHFTGSPLDQYAVSLPYNAKPLKSIELTVEGFLGDDTAESIGLKPLYIPEDRVPKAYEPDMSYKFFSQDFVNHDQVLENYEFNPRYFNAFIIIGNLPEDDPKVLDLTYNGKFQNGISAKESMRVSDSIKRDAGTYYAKAQKAEYLSAFSDGTRYEKAFKWTIKPAELTARYVSEEVDPDGKPVYKVEVTGFVNGETAETAKGFKMPVVIAPDKLAPGKSYTLAPEGGEAANYVFKYEPGTLKVTGEPEQPVLKDLKPGTYTVSANLFIPGELNKQLPGVTAYMTNPNNPLGISEDESVTVEQTAPTTPVSDNATLTVAEDGTRTLTFKLPNPVFTLQQIKDGDNVQVIDAPRNDKRYANGDGSVSRDGRITSLTVKLLDDSGHYVFKDCVEFPTILGADWHVPMHLSVDFSKVPVKAGGDKKVAKPMPYVGMKYNGGEQVGVQANEAYELSGDVKAVDAGSYEATATLRPGFAWADGTTAPAKVSWTIAKAPLKAAYVSETVKEGETPALAVEVTGFVGKDSAATLEGFVAPTVTAPEDLSLEGGKSKTFELSPEGGQPTANYEFDYVKGTLTVEPANSGSGVTVDTGDGFVVKVAPKTEAEAAALLERTRADLEAKVKAAPSEAKGALQAILDAVKAKTLIASYDISLYRDGVKVTEAVDAQGKKGFKVTIANPAFGQFTDIEVLHELADGKGYERIVDVAHAGEEISFVTTSFSTFSVFGNPVKAPGQGDSGETGDVPAAGGSGKVAKAVSGLVGRLLPKTGDAASVAVFAIALAGLGAVSFGVARRLSRRS